MSELYEIVDSHHHLFDFGEASYSWLKPGSMHRFGSIDPIARNYLPDDYRRDTAGYRVVADVHVEGHRDHGHHPVDETRWLARLRQDTGLPSVCVGAADLEKEDIAEVLADHAAFDFARGVRSTPRQMFNGAMMGNAAMEDERWRRGYALLERHNFVCDLLVQYPDMAQAAQLARDFPRTTLILNHMAYPPVDLNAEDLAAWRTALEAVAPLANVVMKVSGMCLGGVPWRSEFHLQPILDVIGILGAERCMFGSNFPVDRLAGSFDTIVSGMRAAVSKLPDQAQRQFFRDTAARVYRIGLPA